MTTLTNKQMFNNVMTILNKMEITEEDDFKKEMNKAIKNAMKDKTTVKKTTVKKTKEPKEPKEPTDYQLFFKEKYPEVKEKFDPKERMKAIAILWKKHKEASSDE